MLPQSQNTLLHESQVTENSFRLVVREMLPFRNETQNGVNWGTCGYDVNTWITAVSVVAMN